MTPHDDPRIRERLAAVGDPVSFLTNLFTHAPVGFAVWHADGRALLTNRAFMEIFRSEPPPEYNVLEDDLLAANGMLPLFQRAFRGETVQVPTFWYDPRELKAVSVHEGRRVAVSMTIFPLRDARGEIEYVAATYKDETALLASAETHLASEERLRLAQHVAQIGTFEWNIQTGVNTWTPELEAIYGLDRGAFGNTQRSWEDLIHPDDRTAAVARVSEALETFLPVEGEWRVVRPDGSLRWLVGRFQAFPDAEGKPSRLIGVNLDVTSRKESEAAARESDARRAAVMAAALDAIVLMDRSGEIVDFNAAAERTFGYARAEVMGKPLEAVLVPPALRDRHRTALARYLETGEGSIIGKRIEVSAMRKDGTEFPAEVAVVRASSDGAPVFTGYIRDISERRKAAENELLRREKEAAQAANQELEAFSYSVAHDLRAPLRGMSGFSGALLEDHGDELTPPARALLDRIMAAAERMAQMIDVLLALARLSRASVQRAHVDLTQLARAVVEELRAHEPARSVEIEVSEGMTASGDPELLRVVLENLLGNAWKFTRKSRNACIEVGRRSTPDGEHYYVRDNGAGFEMAHAKRLFTPFQRLHSQDQFEGTGIGLATVQRIVRRHGGRIWAEGRADAGAVFEFTLGEHSPKGQASWMPAK